MITDSNVTGVKKITLKNIKDDRGSLTVGNFPSEIPFLPKRYFVVYGVPNTDIIRGQHAHKECEQFLICLSGSCTVIVDDGKNKETFVLDAPSVGLYLPKGIWGEQFNYSANCSLLVFASHEYSNEDYIRDYIDFKKYKSQI